jgi:hypothetical protein
MYLLIKKLIFLKLFNFLNKPLIFSLLFIGILSEFVKQLNKSKISLQKVINIIVYKDQNISTSVDKVFII